MWDQLGHRAVVNGPAGPLRAARVTVAGVEQTRASTWGWGVCSPVFGSPDLGFNQDPSGCSTENRRRR